jgi:hypothetical protein
VPEGDDHNSEHVPDDHADQGILNSGIEAYEDLVVGNSEPIAAIPSQVAPTQGVRTRLQNNI